MKSEKNKLNRAKMDGPSYAGGSIPISEHRQKIAESGDVPEGMIDWATFERTHSQQDSEGGGKRWINAKSQQFAETFQKLTNERDSQSECDPASSQSDNTDIFIEAAGGFNKKGRLFGMGASASRLKPTKRSSSSSEEGVSSDELKRMKALVQEQAEQLNQQRELMSQQQEQLTQQEQRTASQLSEQAQRISQQENELQQTREMMRQMQLTLMSIMKGKGSGPAPGDVDHPGDDDDDDDHNAAV